MDLIRYDKPADCILQGYAWYNSSEKKIEHADGGLYSYYEPCKLEHKGALTVYFSMDETSAEKTIAAGEDIYCIRSDGDGGCMCVQRTEQKDFYMWETTAKSSCFDKSA